MTVTMTKTAIPNELDTRVLARILEEGYGPAPGTARISRRRSATCRPSWRSGGRRLSGTASPRNRAASCVLRAGRSRPADRERVRGPSFSKVRWFALSEHFSARAGPPSSRPSNASSTAWSMPSLRWTRPIPPVRRRRRAPEYGTRHHLPRGLSCRAGAAPEEVRRRGERNEEATRRMRPRAVGPDCLARPGLRPWTAPEAWARALRPFPSPSERSLTSQGVWRTFLVDSRWPEGISPSVPRVRRLWASG